jgi:thioredoxin 1
MSGNRRILINGLILVILIFGLLQPAWSQGPSPRQPKPAILEFSRTACPICKRMEDVLLQVKKAYGSQVEIRILHVETAEPQYRYYQIVIIPTQVFLDASGKEVFRHEGEISQESLVKKLKELKFIK